MGEAGNGFSFNNNCDVLGASKIGGVCYHSKNFFEASDLCKDAGGRLCSRAEMESKCTSGTGCLHDIDLVWTCSDNGQSCASNSDCCSDSCDPGTGTCVSR